MTQKLSAARGADMRIIYYFPPGSVLGGCSGQFVVYDRLGGAPVLIAGAVANASGSQVGITPTTIVLGVKQADIDALPENPDPASARVFYFDLRLITGDGQITKVHGGAFVVMPLGSKTYLNNGAVNATIGGDPIFVQFAGIADIGGVGGGGGGPGDPFAQSNIDVAGATEEGLALALGKAQDLGTPLTGNTGTLTITGAKDLTGCHVHMPFKSITFGTDLGNALGAIAYPVGEEGNTTLKAVVGPAVDMGGSPASAIHYEKVIRLVGGYAGDGLNQAVPFTAVRVEGDQSSRSSYDIALQNHRGDGLEINSDTEKKVITYRFDHLYEGYALAFRSLNLASPDEVNVKVAGTFCSNLVHAQDVGQFSYRVDFNVESVKPWVGSYAIEDNSRKGTCYAGEIRGVDGDLIKVETRQEGYTSGGPTVVFDSLRVIQHYCGRIVIINPKSVGGTIYHDQVDTGRQQGSNYLTSAFRNTLPAGTGAFMPEMITRTDQAGFQIGAVLENCALTYVTRRNVCPYGARIGISDWVNPASAAGSAFSGKAIRLEMEMGDRNIPAAIVTGSFAAGTISGQFSPHIVTGSFDGNIFTSTAGPGMGVGQKLEGADIPPDTHVVAVLSGGKYKLNRSLSLNERDVTVGMLFTLSSGGSLSVGQVLQGTGIPAGTRVTGLISEDPQGRHRINTRAGLPEGVVSVSVGTVFTVTSGAALVVGQFLKGVGIPLGTRITAIPAAGQYTINRSFSLASLSVNAGATADMFYAIWADFGTGSTIWANGNLQGNIRIAPGWKRGAIHVSAAWLRAGYTVWKEPGATSELIIHGPISFAELTGISWAFEGVTALNVTDYGGLSMRHNGAKWVLSRLIDVPAVSTLALGSPLNAPDVKRLGLSVVDQPTGTILVAQGPEKAHAWLSTAGGTVSPVLLTQTTGFDARQQAAGGGGLLDDARLVYDRLFHDLIYAGVYDPSDASASLLKGLYLLNGPNEWAARTNLLFDFWPLNKVGTALAHTPKVGFGPAGSTNSNSYLEVTGFAADMHGAGTHNIALGACAEALYTSAQQSAAGGPYTMGSNTNRFRTVLHRSDGGNNMYLNSSSPVNATSWAGTYRLGMGYSDSATTQAIQLYGGTLNAVTNKTADAAEVTNLYIFRAQNTYLARTLSMALIGKGVGWDAGKVEATLAALNRARNGLRNLT